VKVVNGHVQELLTTVRQPLDDGKSILLCAVVFVLRAFIEIPLDELLRRVFNKVSKLVSLEHMLVGLGIANDQRTRLRVS
jgi:hypothetical protein